MKTNLSRSPSYLDVSGILCSVACAAHCLLIPIIALALPSVASFFEHEWIHQGLLLILTPVALIAFFRGLKVHGKKRPMLLGFTGVHLLLLAVALEAFFKVEIHQLEVVLTSVGCVLLIFAHIINIQNLKQARIS